MKTCSLCGTDIAPWDDMTTDAAGRSYHEECFASLVEESDEAADKYGDGFVWLPGGGSTVM
jgi:hypothetical protein